jgi:hypothetical protein
VEFLDNLRKKTDHEKKVIIWTVLIIIGAVFLFLWAYTSQRSIRGLQTDDVIEKINIPTKEDIPQSSQPSEEDARALEELMNQLEQENNAQ